MNYCVSAYEVTSKFPTRVLNPLWVGGAYILSCIDRLFCCITTLQGGLKCKMLQAGIYIYGPPHMAKKKQDAQLEHTYSYVRIWDVALKTCQR